MDPARTDLECKLDWLRGFTTGAVVAGKGAGPYCKYEDGKWYLCRYDTPQQYLAQDFYVYEDEPGLTDRQMALVTGSLAVIT